MIWWQTTILAIYSIAIALLMMVSLHRFYMVRLYNRFRNRIVHPPKSFETLPFVTIQLPIYNERYVVERLIHAVTKLDYPKNRLEIQILDDSTDETTHMAMQCIIKLQQQGINIHLWHRTDRTGFKAGALAAGLKVAQGDLIAIFDADFLPPRHFLQRTVHHFTNPNVGMVQARWGHLNRDYSLLTADLSGHCVAQ